MNVRLCWIASYALMAEVNVITNPDRRELTSTHILIAGAGIGGIVAALALAQHGYTVSVYEQAQELRELGAGLQITPNGSRILHELGLGAALDDIASVPASREARLF